ncbi:MAG: 50S ribosomal protein L24 [Clostridia bacterium]|nr:50S ribosomal protein L24 [Clostridia bacterium]
MSNMHVKKGDTVMVISGAAGNGKKATTGKVLVAFPADNRVLVEGVNMRWHHRKPRGQQDPGGRMEQEAPIAASNVMLYCGKCKKPTRIAHKVVKKEKIRVCRHCGNDLG